MQFLTDMLRASKHSFWLVPAVTLLGMGITAKVNAQTVYPFDTSYDTEVTLIPIPSTDVLQAFIFGNNPNAPYGLTSFQSINNYSRLDPATGNLVFVQDASLFGLQGFPIGGEEFFGSGNDRLFGNSSAIASFNFANGTLDGTGVVNITGGTGRFQGAIGTLNFTESEPLNEDPTAPLSGKTFLNGSFQVADKIPEPTTNMALFGVAAIGLGFLRRRQQWEKQ
jgi:hypothetical protein